MTRTPSSDPTGTTPPAGILSARRGRVIVLEGMPGAGKTTAAEALAGQGRTVIGEYLDHHGGTLPVTGHPGVDDEQAHLSNWLTKHQHLSAAGPGPAFLDRDWVSALAYAYSLPGAASAHELAARARWAVGHLQAGRLAVGDTYVVFGLGVRLSLRRRASRLTPGHPWSHPHGLARLARFYRNPPAALEPVHTLLAEAMRGARWRHLAGLSVEQTLRLLRNLADRPCPPRHPRPAP